jgi:hypothetical protein
MASARKCSAIDAGSFLHLPQSHIHGGIGRIEEHGNTLGLGHQLMQES